MSTPRRRRIGVLGGTFDPVHIGHLALARSAQVALGLDELRLIPTGASWQKSGVRASPQQRLEMVELAARFDPRVTVDGREVRRSGPSYTVDTLTELRQELGPDAALILILGSDQMHNLASWHRWQDLLSLAHIACTTRERVRLDDLPDTLDQWVRAHGRDALPDAPAGAVVFFTMPPVPVSATVLRAALARGDWPSDLVPAAVLDYIDQHQLYRADPA